MSWQEIKSANITINRIWRYATKGLIFQAVIFRIRTIHSLTKKMTRNYSRAQKRGKPRIMTDLSQIIVLYISTAMKNRSVWKLLCQRLPKDSQNTAHQIRKSNPKKKLSQRRTCSTKRYGIYCRLARKNETYLQQQTGTKLVNSR